MIYNIYSVGGELYHHGVKGMKWGVRRYQPYSSGYQSKSGGKFTGKKGSSIDINKTKKFLTRDTDASKKADKLREEYEKQISSIPKEEIPKDNEWMTEDRKWTQKAISYMDKTDAIYEKYKNEDKRIWEEHQKELDDLRKEVFFNDEIKDKIRKAHKTFEEISKVRKDTIDESSKYARDGYQQYLKDHPDSYDSEYGFFHYEWNEYSNNEFYKKALKEYEKRSIELCNEYEKQLESIGRQICGDLADTKIDDYFTYLDVGMNEADNLIRFKREYFK